MQLHLPTSDNIQRAAQILRAGGLVAMPTETVYGLAANGLDPEAVAKIFAAKARPHFDPLIVHVAQPLATLSQMAQAGLIDDAKLSDAAKHTASILMEAFWPGPLTLVLPRGPLVPDLVTSGLDTVAVRCPSHPVAQALLVASGLFLAAPSANRFGRISPTCAAHVEAELGDRVDFILDGGPCAVGIESTILSIDEEGGLWLLRPGGVALDAIEGATQIRPARPSPQAPQAPQAPGMLASHYAPRTGLRLLPGRLRDWSQDALLALWRAEKPPRLGVLLVDEDDVPIVRDRLLGMGLEAVWVLALGRRGDWAQAAQNLFSCLRSLDEAGASILWAEEVLEDTSLAYAIADRLRRAAAR